jgi:hypothetical protein
VLHKRGKLLEKPFGNERMSVGIGMYSINGKSMIAEDAVHEIGDEKGAVLPCDFFIPVAILVAEESEAHVQDNRHGSMVGDAPDDMIKVAERCRRIHFPAEVVSPEFHEDDAGVVRQDIPLESCASVGAGIAVPAGIYHLHAKRLGEECGKRLSGADAVACRYAVAETHDGPS